MGVIGVVAAMTMPVLIGKYKHRVLETQFKKVYSELSQTSQLLISEYGNVAKPDESYYLAVKDFFVSKLKGERSEKIRYKDADFKTYNLEKTEANLHYNCLTQNWGNGAWFTLTNGTEIGICGRVYRGVGASYPIYTTLITADINGKSKGPNALGHDIFFFKVDTNSGKIVSENLVTRTCDENDTTHENCKTHDYYYESAACSKTNSEDTNGVGCADYAISNVCPDDETKNYWDCLP